MGLKNSSYSYTYVVICLNYKKIDQFAVMELILVQ